MDIAVLPWDSLWENFVFVSIFCSVPSHKNAPIFPSPLSFADKWRVREDMHTVSVGLSVNVFSLAHLEILPFLIFFLKNKNMLLTFSNIWCQWLWKSQMLRIPMAYDSGHCLCLLSLCRAIRVTENEVEGGTCFSSIFLVIIIIWLYSILQVNSHRDRIYYMENWQWLFVAVSDI